jgi:hypothetical protein
VSFIGNTCAQWRNSSVCYRCFNLV